MTRRARAPRRALIAVAAVVLAGVLTAGVLLTRTSDVVATVDGHPVTRAALAFHMDRLRAAVQNEVQVARGSTGEPLDWSTEADGRSAADLLRERALDTAVADTVLLVVAQEAGVVDDADLGAVLAARDAENDRRAEAVARGEVVYGPTTLGAQEHYAGVLTEVRTRVLERLGAEPGDPLHVTDADVEAAYAAAPQDWAANATTYRLTRLTVPVTGDREAARAALAADVAAQSADLEAVAAAHPGAILAAETIAGTTGLTPPQQEALQRVAGLAAGEATDPADEGDALVVLRVDDVAVDGEQALAAYASRIRAALADERLDAYLDSRTDDSDIVVDHAALASTEPEGTRS
ncbi:peptidyl-prolyl cis-trans isomerase [Cellulomonas hominis]|uniref:peptidyl-prolyl cis-trans isomerase n=1 Tax=Cellulomonas hominis TaxID=156981 RepID=UPI001C12637C|nr:peptidyl-prolyl cis-trans isomerase [Cellulomonas hominis]MBU5422987.1 peptidyl-prolyl cis-trans isomerase [Cellulomonas hominis]